MDVETFFLFLVVYLFQGARGRAVFEVTLLQYRAAEKCCGSAPGKCNVTDCVPQFEVCLTQNISNTQSCDKIPAMNSTNKIAFGEVKSKPFSLMVETLKDSLEITVKVEDYENDNRTNYMDTARYMVKDVGTTTAHKVVLVATSGNKYAIKVVASYVIKCAEDYYGQQCEDECVSNERYNCDENGTRTCLTGFEGPSCTQTTTIPDGLRTTTTTTTTRTSSTNISQGITTSTTNSTETTSASSPMPSSASTVTTSDTSSPGATPFVRADTSSVTSTSPMTSEITTPMSQGSVCYRCQEMGHLIYCDTIEQCKPNEICYVSKYIKGERPIFQSGCLPTEICRIQEYLSANVSNECVDCCEEDFCNNKGCGDDGYIDRDSRGPLCLDCMHVSDPDECRTLTLCQRDQLCSIEEYRWGDASKFTLGCASKLCLSITQSDAMEKRALPVCHACCDHDNCNRNCTQSASIFGGILIG